MGAARFEGTKCGDAYNKEDQKLILTFKKTSMDNPKIDALILYNKSINRRNEDVPQSINPN